MSRIRKQRRLSGPSADHPGHASSARIGMFFSESGLYPSEPTAPMRRGVFSGLDRCGSFAGTGLLGDSFSIFPGGAEHAAEPCTPDRWVSEQQGLSDSMDRLVPDPEGVQQSIARATYQMPGQLCNAADGACGSHKLQLACAMFDATPAQCAGRVQPIGQWVRPPKRTPFEDHDRNLRVIYARNKRRNFKSRSFRYIPQTPERILDAPDLIDDYYLNLLDWSCNNVLTVALNQTVYLWNADTGDIQQLTQTADEENPITSVSFSQDGQTLAVGTNSTEVELWDVARTERLRVIKGHAGRVVSLDWNGRVIASGSRDATVMLHDARSDGRICQLRDHEQEVCGLKWSADGSQLASGGNDNLLHIWDNSRMNGGARLRLTAHSAAVKALAWSPHQSSMLASGGGAADRTLRFWNTCSGECLSSLDTKSQVCSMVWAPHLSEILTSHGRTPRGYSENQLSLWKYPSMKRVANLTGHTSRVLHLALSPDGQTVVSAAGDETIRFWRCFAVEQQKKRDTLPLPEDPFSPLGLR